MVRYQNKLRFALRGVFLPTRDIASSCEKSASHVDMVEWLSPRISIRRSHCILFSLEPSDLKVH